MELKSQKEHGNGFLQRHFFKLVATSNIQPKTLTRTTSSLDSIKQRVSFDAASDIKSISVDSVSGKEHEYKQTEEDIGRIKGFYLSGETLLLLLISEYVWECVFKFFIL